VVVDDAVLPVVREAGDGAPLDERRPVGLAREPEDPDRVTDDEGDAVVARDRVEQQLARVAVLVHVPDGSVAAREDDRLVAVGVDGRDRFRIVQFGVLFVDLAELSDPLLAARGLGVERALVDDRGRPRRRRDGHVDALRFERRQRLDTLLGPDAVCLRVPRAAVEDTV
jgi:hypothetical protein